MNDFFQGTTVGADFTKYEEQWKSLEVDAATNKLDAMDGQPKCERGCTYCFGMVFTSFAIVSELSRKPITDTIHMIGLSSEVAYHTC